MKTPLKTLAALGLAVGAWMKLSKDLPITRPVAIGDIKPEYPPITTTGFLTFAEWETRYGGSYLDYEDWRRGL